MAKGDSKIGLTMDGQGAPAGSEQAKLEKEAEAVATKELEETKKALAGKSGNSWEIAGTLVRQFRPVPWILWTIIRNVYGSSGKLGAPDPIAFDPVTLLMQSAAKDKSLFPLPEGQTKRERMNLEDAVNGIGIDVAAAVCFIHGVCRRIAMTIAERTWRPIVDDALLRAHIGFYVGKRCKKFGAGRGMIAGFSGRSGLAVQIASAEPEKVQRTLEGLAAGMPMRDVGLTVFGCDPLQVSAMVLTAAGVASEAAMGIASFSAGGQEELNPNQKMWLSAFAIIEHLRMGRIAQIQESDWRRLEFDPAGQKELLAQVQQLQRKGHNWAWLVNPMSGA